MFNQILKLNPKLQNDPNNSSSIKLFDAFNLVGKVMLTTNQWNKQFTKIQSAHGPQQSALKQEQEREVQNSFTEKLASEIKTLSTKQCELCKKEQPKQNFKEMCKCDHKFCYSCLNAYAIAKIESRQRVACPEPTCSSELKLSSQTYKFLPEIIKLKYLQWKTQNKSKLIDLSDSCLRCLELRHSGPCKVSFSSQNIEAAFNFRKCFKCKSEVSIPTGKKKVSCQPCNVVFCYVCGQAWPLEGSHTCSKDQKVFQLQKEVKESSEAANKNQYCCEDSESKCIKNCGKCISSSFYCKRCNFNICLGNFVLIPIRLIGTAIGLALYTMVLIPTLILILGWLLTGIFTGMTCYGCEIFDKLSSGCQVLAILGFPFLMLAGIYLGLKNTYSGFSQMMGSIFTFYSTVLCEIWISCGPKECCL